MFRTTLFDMMHRLPYLAADGGVGNGGAGAGTGGESGGEGGGAPATLDALFQTNPAFQAEFDRRMTKGIETAKAKWQQDADARLADARTEAEKLAKMTAEQKAEHDRQKRDKELTEREATLVKRELRAQAAETLAQKGLPAALLDVIAYDSADGCNASITAVEAAFRAAVQSGVEERMKGKPPKAGAASPDTDKMTDAEYYANMKQK